MPSFYEEFRYPLLEAMNHGTPVITSNVSSMPEVVGKAGILVDPHEPTEIAKGIEQALSSSIYHEQLIKNSLEQAKSFSSEKMIDSILEIYKDIAYS